MTQMDLEHFEPQIIKTQDEEGKIHEFELIDIISVEDKNYGLLVYLNDDESPKNKEEDEEEEVVVMRLNIEDDRYTFESIENEEEFNKVLELLQLEMTDDDEDEDEDEEE